jgi:hypothetical protein
MRHAAIALVLVILLVYATWGTTEARVDASACDTLAADPDDTSSAVPGVPDEDIRAGLAIPACESAVSEQPTNVRYLVQLGRAYHRAGRHEDAVATWNKAAKLGSSAAVFYLARTRMGEYWAVADDDAVRAREILAEIQRSLEPAMDFPPAQGLVSSLSVQPTDFRMRTLVRLLMAGDYARINRSRLPAAWWALGVQESMNQSFHPDCQDFPARLVQPAITRALEKAEAGDPTNLAEALIYRGGKKVGGWALFLTDFVWAGDLVKWRDWVKSIGMADGLALSKNYCQTPAAEEFYRQVVQLANTPLRLSEYANDFVTLRSVRDVMPEIVPYIEDTPSEPEDTDDVSSLPIQPGYTLSPAMPEWRHASARTSTKHLTTERTGRGRL